jgi:hypothetical protein
VCWNRAQVHFPTGQTLIGKNATNLSLVAICNSEPTSKSIIAGAIKAVVFGVDPTSATSDPFGSEYGRCYSVALSGAELCLAYYMDALDRPTYAFYDKLDALFELSVAKALHTGFLSRSRPTWASPLSTSSGGCPRPSRPTSSPRSAPRCPNAPWLARRGWAVVAQPVGKSAVASAVYAVLFAADVEGKQPRKGSIMVTLNLDEVLSAARWTDWKARLADAVGVLLPIAHAEAQTALGGTASQLSAALGRPTAVQVGWEAFAGARMGGSRRRGQAQQPCWATRALKPHRVRQRQVFRQPARPGTAPYHHACRVAFSPIPRAVVCYGAMCGRVSCASVGATCFGPTGEVGWRGGQCRTHTRLSTGHDHQLCRIPNALCACAQPQARNRGPPAANPPIHGRSTHSLFSLQAVVVAEVNKKTANAEKKVAAALGKPIAIKIDWDIRLL